MTGINLSFVLIITYKSFIYELPAHGVRNFRLSNIEREEDL